MNLLSYIFITIMLVMLGVLVFRLVPDSLAIPFFVVALVLFVTRRVLRMQLAKQERDTLQSKRSPSK